MAEFTTRASGDPRNEAPSRNGTGNPAEVPAALKERYLAVRAATEALDAVIGVVSVDDILDRVFRDFCVGK